jgi:hypothetical protein
MNAFLASFMNLAGPDLIVILLIIAVVIGIPAVLIALLIVSIIGGSNRKRELASRTCPFCAEIIKKEAIVCRYCGRDIPDGTAQPATHKQAGESKVS